MKTFTTSGFQTHMVNRNLEISHGTIKYITEDRDFVFLDAMTGAVVRRIQLDDYSVDFCTDSDTTYFLSRKGGISYLNRTKTKLLRMVESPEDWPEDIDQWCSILVKDGVVVSAGFSSSNVMIPRSFIKISDSQGHRAVSGDIFQYSRLNL